MVKDEASLSSGQSRMGIPEVMDGIFHALDMVAEESCTVF